MSATGFDIFDRTVQKTNLLLEELGEALHMEDRHDVYLSLRTVLHALRDRLHPAEAAQLAAQLPMLLKGVYFDGWRPASPLVKVRDRQEFLDGIREPLRSRMPTADAERITRAVFALLAAHVSAGEIEQVVTSLPEELRDLWPATEADALPD
ncbi:MAG: DUF2267 domain-containing protein [Gemmatimonadota bacterium]